MKGQNREFSSKNVAILVTDGFEEVELTKPLEALERMGIAVEIVAPKATIVSAVGDNKGSLFPADTHLGEAVSLDYDALILPGGVRNPDKLRQDPKALAFVKSFFLNRKPVAAICHGAWTLVEADVVEGRTLTSYPSLKTDIENAGGIWVDKEVVSDNGLITSRTPEDLDMFISKILEALDDQKQEFFYA